ncbi:hypothetical protein HYT02_01985 [Candidatus Gottesmanbacteria bacterium]|nr:hypothetical protein [Candidatus Gottesmanbacteria bacterium]
MPHPELVFYKPTDDSGSLGQGGNEFQQPFENKQPQRILFTRSMFPENSIGYTVFPDNLEGRMRSEAILDKPLSRIFSPDNKGIPFLTQAGISSLGQLLLTETDSLDSLLDPRHQKNIRKRLTEHLQHYSLTSHAHLLQDIFEGRSKDEERKHQEYPVPFEREKELVDGVEEQVQKLKELETDIITRYYGLKTDVPQTYEEIRPEYGLTKHMISIKVNQILRRLRHPFFSVELRKYRSLSPQSVGRQIGGHIFYKDIPEVPRYISTELLSTATLNELLSKAADPSEFPDLLKDLFKFQLRKDSPDLSRETVEDIKTFIEDMKTDRGTD